MKQQLKRNIPRLQRQNAKSMEEAEKIKAGILKRNAELTVDIYCVTSYLFEVEWFE